MDWEKINIKAIMELLRGFEKNSICLDGKFKVIYSDGKEELEIIYRKLEEKKLK